MGLSNYILSTDIDEQDKEIEEEQRNYKMEYDIKNYLGKPDPYHVGNCCTAQAKLCKEKNYPHFAPSDGICWSCHRQIYDRITLGRASSELITGCPWCNRSYCD